MAYRDTPHPATGIIPYEAIMNRPVRTKLAYTVPRKEGSSRDKMMDEKDRQYKEKMTEYGGSSKEHNFVVGDHVLLRQRKRNNWSTPYEPVFYTVIKISGSAIAARRITDGREVGEMLVNSNLQTSLCTRRMQTRAVRVKIGERHF